MSTVHDIECALNYMKDNGILELIGARSARSLGTLLMLAEGHSFESEELNCAVPLIIRNLGWPHKQDGRIRLNVNSLYMWYQSPN